MERSTSRRRYLVGVGTVALGGLAGCSSGGDTGGGDTGSDPTETPSTTEEMTATATPTPETTAGDGSTTTPGDQSPVLSGDGVRIEFSPGRMRVTEMGSVRTVYVRQGGLRPDHELGNVGATTSLDTGYHRIYHSNSVEGTLLGFVRVGTPAIAIDGDRWQALAETTRNVAVEGGDLVQDDPGAEATFEATFGDVDGANVVAAVPRSGSQGTVGLKVFHGTGSKSRSSTDTSPLQVSPPNPDDEGRYEVTASMAGDGKVGVFDRVEFLAGQSVTVVDG